SQESIIMSSNPKTSDSDDADAIALTFDAEPTDASELGESLPPVAPVHSRPTKLDRGSSSRNTALHLPRQDSPAPESNAGAELVAAAPEPGVEFAASLGLSAAPAPAQPDLATPSEALIDAVFTAAGATEWLALLALSLTIGGAAAEGYEILTAANRRAT